MPASGQSWTCLTKLRAQGFKNVWKQDAVDERVWFIQSEPKVLPSAVEGLNLGLVAAADLKIGIGQRAIFLQTEHGNVLWDMVPFISEDFVKEVSTEAG